MNRKRVLVYKRYKIRRSHESVAEISSENDCIFRVIMSREKDDEQLGFITGERVVGIEFEPFTGLERENPPPPH